MKKITIFLASLMMVLAVSFTVAPAASAGTVCDWSGICGDLTHVNDEGFDGPIPATCNLGNPWSNWQWVYEGQTASCHDTDGFYVDYGRTVSCYIGGEWLKFSTPGRWYKINDGQDFNCVHGLP